MNTKSLVLTNEKVMSITKFVSEEIMKTRAFRPNRLVHFVAAAVPVSRYCRSIVCCGRAGSRKRACCFGDADRRSACGRASMPGPGRGDA